MLCVQPCSRLRDQIQALLLLPLEPVRIWLLLSITAELVAEAAGADSAPGPGLDGSLGCLGEWELPLFLTLPHTKLVTSGSAEQTGSL